MPFKEIFPACLILGVSLGLIAAIYICKAVDNFPQ